METNKTARRRRKASQAVPGLAGRLKKAREIDKRTRQQVATDLGWSVTALRNYETGATCPTLWDLLELARLYGVDPAALAFGSPAAGQVTKDGELRWVQGFEGGSVPIAGSLLKGQRGRLAAAPTVAPARGMVVFRTGSMPSTEGGLAAVKTGWGVEVMRIWRTGQRWSAARHGTLHPVPLERQQVLGAVAVVCEPTPHVGPKT